MSTLEVAHRHSFATSRELLDYEVETLKKAGFDIPDVKNVSSHLPSPLPESSSIPFLLVPPDPVLANNSDLQKLLDKINVSDHKGQESYINVANLINGDDPDKHERVAHSRLLIDVRNGQDRKSISPRASLKAIREEKRYPLTWFEGVVLAILFPEMIEKLTLILLGSRCDSTHEFAPDISINPYKKTVILGYTNMESPSDIGRAPCAGEYIEIA